MTREHLLEMFRTIDARAWDRLGPFLHPDITYERPGFDPMTGRETLLHFYREVRVIGAGVHSFDAVVIDGDRGACWGRFVGATREGAPVDVQFADCYGFADGMVRSRKSFFFTPVV